VLSSGKGGVENEDHKAHKKDRDNLQVQEFMLTTRSQETE
jgi:hypothetical protein